MSEELLLLAQDFRCAEDLDSFELNLEVAAMSLDDPDDWSTSVDECDTTQEDDSERSNATAGSTKRASGKAKRPPRVRKNYDPPFGEREYYSLSARDVGKRCEKDTSAFCHEDVSHATATKTQALDEERRSTATTSIFLRWPKSSFNQSTFAPIKWRNALRSPSHWSTKCTAGAAAF